MGVQFMPVVSITLNDEEYRTLKKFAKDAHAPMSKVLKNAFFSKFDDEYGLDVFDKENDPEALSVDEVIEDLGLDNK